MIQNLFPISSFFKVKFMFKHIFYAVLLFVSTMTTQCSKTTTAVPDDPNALPPETQTGANTYACKINGVVWKYKDPDYQSTGSSPKTRWRFDSSTNGGGFFIAGFRYLDGTNNDDLLTLGIDSILTKKEFVLNPTIKNFNLIYTNSKSLKKDCNQFGTLPFYDTTSNYYSSGNLFITKLDQNSKIISGTFNCTIYQTGCDTLKITEGRFDIKYQ